MILSFDQRRSNLQLLGEFLSGPLQCPTPILCDNQSAIFLAKNPVQHQRSKHIDIKYHFIRSEILSGNIDVKYIASEDNVSDIFTKPTTRTKLDKFASILMGQ